MFTSGYRTLARAALYLTRKQTCKTCVGSIKRHETRTMCCRRLLWLIYITNWFVVYGQDRWTNVTLLGSYTTINAGTGCRRRSMSPRLPKGAACLTGNAIGGCVGLSAPYKQTLPSRVWFAVENSFFPEMQRLRLHDTCEQYVFISFMCCADRHRVPRPRPLRTSRCVTAKQKDVRQARAITLHLST